MPDGAEPSRLFVDSSAWIALISARDTRHGEVEQMFRHAVGRRIALLTTNLVVAEVHRFILFRAGIRPAALAIDRIDASALLQVEFVTRSHHSAARDWLAHLDDQKISYTDAVSFAVMEARSCTTAISLDHDFVLAGFHLWRAAH